MALVSELINEAYRESNLISIAATPTSLEQAEALRLLNRIRRSVYGTELGELLESLPVGDNNISSPAGYPDNEYTSNDDLYIPLNRRLMLNITAPLTVRLHPNPNDGARFAFIDNSNNLATNPLTVIGNGRKISNGFSQVFNTNSQKQEFVYSDALGEWTSVTNDLISSDPWPFPAEFDDMFVIMLAMRLNPRHGQTLDDQTLLVFRRAKKQFKARYSQVINMPNELAHLRLTGTGREQIVGFNSTQTFLNGGPFWW